MSILMSSYTSFPVSFTYTNWKGDTSTRRAQMYRVYFGSNEWHKDPQWLIDGKDLDKNETRTYALKDITNVRHDCDVVGDTGSNTP